MRITKKVNGYTVVLIMELIKNYPRFGLYQIYKRENGEWLPLYRQCFTKMEFRELIKNNFVIAEEIFE